MTLVAQFIPSPATGVWHLGPVPVRAYALCIILGATLGLLLAIKRWKDRGGRAETLETVVLIAVPFGIVGARAYHVITDHQLYFGPGRDWVRIFFIWEGGLGIWGAVALGALGAWIGCRITDARFSAVADAMAPGVILAQAVGRLGNWFNQELFGGPTTLPWGLLIDPAHRPTGYEQFATFHPTFLYELIWNLLVCAILLWADRRWRLGHGAVAVLYVVLYTAGRFFVEGLRIDEANHVLGLRINEWVSLVVFAAALAWFVWLRRRRPGREEWVERAQLTS